MAGEKTRAAALQPASFRGIGFKVETTDMGVGRRTQVHEYPQRDKPYAEDLGRSTRDLNFAGFVVGDDYLDQANKLLGALETPGSGTLIHPWFGSLTVSVKDQARVSLDSGLGVAHFTLSFVESGELTFPSAAASTQAQSRLAADNLQVASVNDFASKFSVSGVQDFVTAAANGNLAKMLGVASNTQLGAALGYASSLSNTVTTAMGLISDPESLGWKIMDSFGLSGLASTISSWSSIVRGLSRTSSSDAMAAPVASTVYTPSRQQADSNAAAVNALGRQALISQAVGASSLVATTSDSTPTPSHDSLIAVRDDLIAAIDKESLSATDQVYTALMVARGAVWNDLTTRAKDNARLTTLTPAETTPALVLAYDYYQDASRAAEIVGRNDIRHPGFVPPNPLKVLTR